MAPELQKIADEIRNNIETYAQNTYEDGHRTHLGASLIGHKCKRFLWFTFRWVYHHKHSGRMQRLFNTGHCEEARIIGWLRGAGYDVTNIDIKTGKQFIISDLDGHFGGSIDGLINISKLGQCLLECKTSKTGASYKNFFDTEMKGNKPAHWSQVCTYGTRLNIKYVVYICKNKNDDDLYIEVTELDSTVGEEMLCKANSIIFSQETPQRLSETAAYYECKMCDYIDICFRNKEAEHNCRSCKNASPVANAEWLCSKQNSVIPKDAIHVDYACWESILC